MDRGRPLAVTLRRFFRWLRRFLVTLRFLHIRQIGWRLFYRLRPLCSPRPVDGVEPRLLPLSEPILRSWDPADGAMTLAGVTRKLDLGNGLREPDGTSTLWHLAFHGFRWLLSPAVLDNETLGFWLIEEWIRAYGRSRRSDVWAPYATAHRIKSWVKWVCLVGPGTGALTGSIAGQTNFLSRWLERDIGGNHLLNNLSAMILGHALVSRDDAFQPWLREFLDELDRQILEDGAHFERSPTYHRQVIEDVLDVTNVVRATAKMSDASVPELTMLVDIAQRMLRWAESVVFPGVGDPLFNDSVRLGPPSLEALRNYADSLRVPRGRRLANPMDLLAASGFAVMQTGPFQLVADVGAPGPNHLPAHGRAGILSFELAYSGEMVIVNGGTDDYGSVDTRAQLRGASGHTTVSVDGLNAAEVWSRFRIAERPRVAKAWMRRKPQDVVELEAFHDGFARQKSGLGRHVRRIEIHPRERQVRLTDTVHGNRRVCLTSYFHFHPRIRLAIADAGHIVFRDDLGSCRGHIVLAEGQIEIRAAPYFEAMGTPQEHSVVVLRQFVSLPHTNLHRMEFAP